MSGCVQSQLSVQNIPAVRHSWNVFESGYRTQANLRKICLTRFNSLVQVFSKSVGVLQPWLPSGKLEALNPSQSWLSTVNDSRFLLAFSSSPTERRNVLSTFWSFSLPGPYAKNLTQYLTYIWAPHIPWCRDLPWFKSKRWNLKLNNIGKIIYPDLRTRNILNFWRNSLEKRSRNSTYQAVSISRNGCCDKIMLETVPNSVDSVHASSI